MPKLSPYVPPHVLLLAALFALYAVLGLSGYGTDVDTYLTLAQGRAFLLGEGYVPSRPPGYPLPEIVISASAMLGGHVLSNLVSAVLGVAGLAAFHALARRAFGPRTALWAVAAAGLNPWWMIAASSSMDYAYAQAFLLLGTLALVRGRPWIAAACLAAAVASRLTTLPLGAFAFAAAFWSGSLGTPPAATARRRIAAAAGGFVALSAAVYLGVYAAVGGDMFQVTADARVGFFSLEGFATFREYLGRYLFKNVFLWGLPAFLGLLAAAAAAWIVRRRAGGSGAEASKLPPAVLAAVAAAALYCQVLFLRLPLEVSYLIPFLFLAVFALGLAPRPRVFAGWVLLGHALIAVASPSLFEIRYDRNSFNGRKASGVAFEPGLKPGVVVEDVLRRPDAEAFYAARYGLESLR